MIAMSFDSLQFDSLVIRGARRSKEIYSVTSLTNLDDLLGERWYIRGINLAGDFCYVEPSTVKFYLKHVKGKPDYQMKDDGTLATCYFGVRKELIFQFVRSDATSICVH